MKKIILTLALSLAFIVGSFTPATSTTWDFSLEWKGNWWCFPSDTTNTCSLGIKCDANSSSSSSTSPNNPTSSLTMNETGLPTIQQTANFLNTTIPANSVPVLISNPSYSNNNGDYEDILEIIIQGSNDPHVTQIFSGNYTGTSTIPIQSMRYSITYNAFVGYMFVE